VLPNMSVNRTRYGKAPWPRSAHCPCCAARPGRLASARRVTSTTRASPSVKRNLALIDRAAIDQGGLDVEDPPTFLMLHVAELRARCGLDKLQPVIVQPGGCGP